VLYQFRTKHQVLGEVQKSRSGVLLVHFEFVFFYFQSVAWGLVSIEISFFSTGAFVVRVELKRTVVPFVSLGCSCECQSYFLLIFF